MLRKGEERKCRDEKESKVARGENQEYGYKEDHINGITLILLHC